MERNKIIEQILELNIWTKQKFQEYRYWNFVVDPMLTLSWLELKPERFYLVESTHHSEEKFTTSVEVRYSLRSGEAAKYKGSQPFYNRYLSTISVDINYLINEESILKYKDEFINDLKK